MLSTYGRGRGSLVQKAVSIDRIHKMESASLEAHAALTSQVFGITTDQGTEKGLADIDRMELASDSLGAAAAPEHLHPCALYMPEHLHI